MKKIFAIFLLSVSVFFTLCLSVKAADLEITGETTLASIKKELADYESEMKNLAEEKKKAQQKVKEIENEIAAIGETINNCEEEIEELKEEIVELEKQIKNKQLEIDNLINFEQIASGDNVYLEYIFNAKSFTDFIYRASVVEQLTAYNDGLIDDMNNLINKQCLTYTEKYIK